MPLVWRYLLRNFLQVFLLSISGFIAVLLVTRFQSIARFAASSASPLLIFQFILVQIPRILPLAVPISSLIASFILFQRMSHSHEITALRVAGLGFAPLAFPLILLGILISLLNFTIVSEISPRCRSLSKSLVYKMTRINPLSLLQKGTMIKFKNAYVELHLLKSGKYAEDVCVILKNAESHRLSLMMAKKLYLQGDQLIGNDVSFISSIDPKNSDSFDHLVIENQSEMRTQASSLSDHLINSNWSFNYDYLNFRMIQAKHAVERGGHSNVPIRAVQEIARRFSLALASSAFILVGMACGLSIDRRSTLRGVIWATALMTLYLVSFVTAKSLKHNLVPSLGLYLLPFPILGLFCYYSLRKISRGIS